MSRYTAPREKQARSGLLISLEGTDGVGKSTQALLLRNRLRKAGHPVILLAEPGSTILGNRLRRLLKYFRYDMTARAELHLFLAARTQLVQERILPSLQQGIIVICDRFCDSTVAYQGYGRGIPIDEIQWLNNIATMSILPQLTILLDMPPEQGLQRRSASTYDRIERESGLDGNPQMIQRIRDGFLELAKLDPHRWVIIDARNNKRVIFEQVWTSVAGLIEKAYLQ
jgi:dTMP kinase